MGASRLSRTAPRSDEPPSVVQPRIAPNNRGCSRTFWVTFATSDLASDSNTSLGKSIHYLPDHLVKHARTCAYLSNLNWTSKETYYGYYNNLAASRGSTANGSITLNDLRSTKWSVEKDSLAK